MGLAGKREQGQTVEEVTHREDFAIPEKRKQVAECCSIVPDLAGIKDHEEGGGLAKETIGNLSRLQFGIDCFQEGKV